MKGQISKMEGHSETSGTMSVNVRTSAVMEGNVKTNRVREVRKIKKDISRQAG